MITVGDVVATIEGFFPPQLAEPWDAVGLVAGRRADAVRRVAVAVDIVDETVDWAIAQHAQLLFTHHPLYLRGTSSVDGDSPKGALVHRAIRAGLALHVAHTNADIARPGVSDAIAHAFGLGGTRPIRPHAKDPQLGIGRVGELDAALPLHAFVDVVAATFPSVRGGIRWAGSADRMIRRVAVCGGAGDDLLDEVDADVYVTSDLRHHVASEYLASRRAALIDVPHAASEALFLVPLARRLVVAHPALDVVVYPDSTEPWSGATR